MHQQIANEDKADQLGLGTCLLIIVCMVAFTFGLSHLGPLPSLDSLQTLPNGSRVFRQPRRAPGFEHQDGDLVFELAKVI